MCEMAEGDEKYRYFVVTGTQAVDGRCWNRES